MKDFGAIHCADTFQSRDTGLLLTLYVDDMLLSGPQKAHAPFWEMMQKHIKIESPTPVDRVLGRHHEIQKMKRVCYHAI